MIEISRQLMDQVIDYCKAALPAEACGVWFGSRDEDSDCLEISGYSQVNNIAALPKKAFLMDPAKWIHLMYARKKNKQRQMVGIFHSHPETPAVPSYEDLQTLWNHLPSYWIISLVDKNDPQICAYRLNGQVTYREIPIVYKSESTSKL